MTKKTATPADLQALLGEDHPPRWWRRSSPWIGLTVLLTILLLVQQVSLFDSLCHAFGAIATGGFSTYNNSVGHFQVVIGPSRALAAEAAIIVFMILAGSNFTLLYFLVIRKPNKLLRDVEWRTYLMILLGVTALVA